MKRTRDKRTNGSWRPGTKGAPLACCVGPIREWVPELGLGRASRPGFESGQVDLAPAVDNWVKAVRSKGVRSVICLLSREELEWYCGVPGGLLGRYQHLGLEVISIPVPLDRHPVLGETELPRITKAFEDLPKPVVVHCSAGVVRSGAAVRHLQTLLSRSEPPCQGVRASVRDSEHNPGGREQGPNFD